MPPIIYENVAVGKILQRIAECRLINFFSDMNILLTQQTRPLEEKYRDMAIMAGDKIIVIEFKAPEITKEGLRYTFSSYKQIQALKRLQRELKNNVFIGLIHARLLRERSSIKSRSGMYKFNAVPATTIFIPANIEALTDNGKNSYFIVTEL